MDRIEGESCGRCGRKPVERVAMIEPSLRQPGFVAWICPACGAADSALLYGRAGRGRTMEAAFRPETAR